MTTKYVHPELGKEVVFGIAGHYTPLEEIRLKYQGRDVLCEIGNVKLESACCGIDSWNYTSVPGYVVSWRSLKNHDGLPVSEIEPITDQTAREEITHIIQEKEGPSPVEFW